MGWVELYRSDISSHVSRRFSSLNKKANNTAFTHFLHHVELFPVSGKTITECLHLLQSYLIIESYGNSDI
jgi:hypothetical protein